MLKKLIAKLTGMEKAVADQAQINAAQAATIQDLSLENTRQSETISTLRAELNKVSAVVEELSKGGVGSLPTTTVFSDKPTLFTAQQRFNQTGVVFGQGYNGENGPGEQLSVLGRAGFAHSSKVYSGVPGTGNFASGSNHTHLVFHVNTQQSVPGAEMAQIYTEALGQDANRVLKTRLHVVGISTPENPDKIHMHHPQEYLFEGLFKQGKCLGASFGTGVAAQEGKVIVGTASTYIVLSDAEGIRFFQNGVEITIPDSAGGSGSGTGSIDVR
jgi:hypothetical protein